MASVLMLALDGRCLRRRNTLTKYDSRLGGNSIQLMSALLPHYPNAMERGGDTRRHRRLSVPILFNYEFISIEFIQIGTIIHLQQN